MNKEQISYLPNELKERYAKLEHLFDSPGWAIIEEWAKTRSSDAQARQLSAGSWDVALLNRGAGLAYGELVNLRESTEAEFAAISAQEAEMKQLRDEEEYE